MAARGLAAGSRFGLGHRIAGDQLGDVAVMACHAQAAGRQRRTFAALAAASASANIRSAPANSPVQNAASINASSAAAQRSRAARPGPVVMGDSVFGAGAGPPGGQGARTA